MTSQEEYNKLADEMKKALLAAKNIPLDILSKASGMVLKVEDYRAIASRLFIQANIDADKGNGKYEGPSSEKQQNFIGVLATEREDAETAIQQFLATNGIESVDKLTSTLATTLIRSLKELPKKTGRK